MDPSIKLDLWLALTVAFSILTLLLWIDRRRLLESKETSGHWKYAVLLYILIVTCSIGAALGWHHVYLSGGNPSIQPSGSGLQQFSEQSPASFYSNLSLVIAALGVFFTFITGFIVAIARHCVEDVRRAGEEQAKLHQKYMVDLENRYRDMKVSSLLDQTRINVIANIASANNIIHELQIDPTSLLVAKLQFLNEARRFRDEGFSVNKLVDSLGDLEKVIQNKGYQNYLRNFFSRDDLDTCKALIDFFRSPTEAGPRLDYQLAVKELGNFIRKLEQITGVT